MFSIKQASWLLKGGKKLAGTAGLLGAAGALGGGRLGYDAGRRKGYSVTRSLGSGLIGAGAGGLAGAGVQRLKAGGQLSTMSRNFKDMIHPQPFGMAPKFSGMSLSNMANLGKSKLGARLKKPGSGGWGRFDALRGGKPRY